MGYHPSEVKFMSLCFFEEIQEPDSENEKQLKGVRGIVAMTDSEVCLMDGATGLAPTRHFLKIPVSEIEGVSGSSDQVQMKLQDKLLVLVVFDWDDFRPNSTLTNHIYRTLLAANVPNFETKDHFSWSMLSASSNSVYNGHLQDSFPSRNKGQQLKDFSREQSARDREFENNRRQ